MLTILRIIEEYGRTLIFIGGLIVGLLLGLLVAWVIMPANFYNATPGHLRSDFQIYYFNAVAEDYARERNLELAMTRLGLLLEDQSDNPWTDKPQQFEEFLQNEILPLAMRTQNDQMDRLARDLAAEMEGVELEEPTMPVEPITPGVEEEPAPEAGRRSTLLIIVLVLLVLALIGGAFYFFTRSQEKPEPGSGRAGAYSTTVLEEEPSAMELEAGPPVSSFTATYVLGDDFFDPSFSIEVGNDFLGECGIGISESIGVGDPKKVTALEAWLFDKSDIRTVTVVLASEYAYSDPSLRAKLSAKGELVEIKPGQDHILETTALRVRVHVNDVEYAEGDLPDNSFFQKASVKLQAWVKNEAPESPEA